MDICGKKAFILLYSFLSMLWYLDTCICISLFKKEQQVVRDKQLWQWSNELLRVAEQENIIILVSTIVLKELAHILQEKFASVKEVLKKYPCVTIVKATDEDYSLARFYEMMDEKSISFYDYTHMSISLRYNAVLVTRDKELLQRTEGRIQASKPEDLIC